MKILNNLFTKGTTSINFDTTVPLTDFPPSTAGSMRWNEEDGTIDVGLYNGVTLQMGQEMYFYARASQPITNGQVVQFAGVDFETVLAKPAVGSEIRLHPSYIMGIATQDIAVGEFGYITWFGIVRDMNTNGWTPGTILYFDCTSNALTNAVPIAPDPKVEVAAVVRTSLITGSFLVRPNFGESLNSLNDVHISGLNTGHIIRYNAATNRWENILLTAANVPVVDTNNYFDATNAETILDELGLTSKILREHASAATGFTNNETIVVNYSSAARTITLNGTFEAFYQGKKVAALVDGWVSAPHNNVAGVYFLYYRNGSFIWSNLSWSFSDLMIAYVQFGANSFALREVHGLMASDTHEELHQTVGTYKISGGDLTGFVIGSTTALNRRPDLSTTTVKDEDLLSTISPLTTKQYTQRYLSGAAVRTFVPNAADIIPLSGNQPYWNQNVAGVWQQTLFSNGDYGAIFVVAIPTTNDAGSQTYKYLFAQPQQVGTLATIQGLTPNNIVHGDAANLVTEFVFIARIIIQYQGGNWTIIQTDKIDGTRNNQVTSAAGTYLSAVNRDATLLGDGTSLNPLTVVDDMHNHVISNVDGLQTALDSKIGANNAALTGTPTAPTAATGTNTTQIATTGFVNAEIANDAFLKTDIIPTTKGGTGRTTFPSGEVLIGALTDEILTLSRSGIDTRTEFPPSTHTHAQYQLTSEKGSINGYAELDATGKVPAAQLPAFVDDVLEYANFAAFPATGESGKIYIAIDTNITYRWSGTVYVAIGSSLALGETSTTAYRGDRGKIAYDHSQLTSGTNPHNTTFANIASKPTTLSGYGITDAAPSSHVGAGGTAHSDVTVAVSGFMSAADKIKLNGIAAGAEVNVQPDWNAVSGDGQILNKPTIPTTASELSFTPAGNIGSLTTQLAIEELDGEKAAKTNPTFSGSLVLLDAAQYLGLKIKSTHVSATPQLLLRDNNESGFDIGYDSVNASISINKTTNGAYESTLFTLHNDYIAYKSNSIWHSGNDGPGSGLNADLWDGYHMPALVADKVLKVNIAGNGLEWGEGGGAVPVGLTAGSASTGFINYNGTTAAAGQMDGGATAPTGTNRLNYGGYFYATRVYNAYYNDYAEYFKKEGELEYGDVVAKKPGEAVYIKSRKAYDKLVVGVYSDSYGQCLGGDGLEDVDGRYASIGLAGRVDVKVVGELEEGDLLVASDIPGVAMKCENYIPGTVIGKALENKIGAGIQKVKMLIVNL